MLALIARRLLAATLALVGISVITWGLMSLAPGDAAQIYARQFAVSGFPTAEKVSFWLSLVLIWIFAASLGWLPSTGRDGAASLVLPALALGVPGSAVVIRLVRAAVIDALAEDYVIAARARGVPERSVVIRHALRNALVPVSTQLGLVFGALLSGAAIVETIFAWPGVGKLAVDAVASQDYPVLQGFVLFSALIYLGVNLGVDLLYRVLDPRVTRETARVNQRARGLAT